MVPQTESTGAVLGFLREAFGDELSGYLQRYPDLTVAVAEPEEHEAFLPAVAELLARERERGTKGMTSWPGEPGAVIQQLAQELETGRAVLIHTADELIGYGTLAPWEVAEGRVVEFCSAVVDEAFRGQGFGRLLVDAREILAVENYVPEGFQPLAFCNENSARIYNPELWYPVPWESYRVYPVPVVCRPECQFDRESCDCLVLAMDLERLWRIAD